MDRLMVRRVMATGMFESLLSHSQQILNHFPSISRYWPLDETSGLVVHDIKAGKTGTVTDFGGVAWGAYPSPVDAEKTSPMFDATKWGRIDVLDPTLTIGNEGFLSFWVRLTAEQWADSSFTYMMNFLADADNLVAIEKVVGGIWPIHKGNGTGVITSSISAPQTGDVHFCFTWSKANNRARLYQMGTLTYPEQSGIVSLVGSLTSAALGTYGAFFDMSGGLNNVILGNTELSQADVIWLMNRSVANIKRLSIIGDSIEAAWNCWNYHVSRAYNNGTCQMINHAVVGTSIMDGMAAQVTAAASDNADAIILCHGTNDDNSGNMATLQATVESAIDTLHATNAHATIYYMNVLPRWTNNTTGPDVDKSNIRTTIAAACTAKSITCWDTYTVPWIAQNQTDDGVHPTTAAGHPAIATQVLAAL